MEQEQDVEHLPVQGFFASFLVALLPYGCAFAVLSPMGIAEQSWRTYALLAIDTDALDVPSWVWFLGITLVVAVPLHALWAWYSVQGRALRPNLELERANTQLRTELERIQGINTESERASTELERRHQDQQDVIGNFAVCLESYSDFHAQFDDVLEQRNELLLNQQHHDNQMRHHVHQIQVLMADAANQHMAVLHVHQDGRILYLNARMQSLTNLTETDVRRPVSLFTGGGNQFLATVLGARTELINAANIGQTVGRSRIVSINNEFEEASYLLRLHSEYAQATAEGQHNAGHSVVMTAIDVTLWPEDAVAGFLDADDA